MEGLKNPLLPRVVSNRYVEKGVYYGKQQEAENGISYRCED